MCGVALADHEMVADPRLQFQRDSIQASSPDALTEEGLFRHNFSFRQGLEYQTVMTRFGSSSWYLTGDSIHWRIMRNDEKG
jgi:hypothetical protein